MFEESKSKCMFTKCDLVKELVIIDVVVSASLNITWSHLCSTYTDRCTSIKCGENAVKQ